MEAEVAQQTAFTTNHIGCKVSDRVAKSLDDILQSPYKNARTEVGSITHNFIEIIPLDLLCGHMIDDILDRRIATYFQSGDDADNMYGELLPNESSMALAPAVHLRAGKTISMPCVAIIRQDRRNEVVLEFAAKCDPSKSVSIPGRMTWQNTTL